jgi:zinc protease
VKRGSIGWWGAVVFAAALGTGGPAKAHETVHQVGRLVLPNGMVVILAPERGGSVIGLHLTYRVGSRDDPESRPGLAAFTQRLMMRATAHVADGEYDRYLDAAGAVGRRWNVDADITTVQMTVPADQIALPLWLWSDQLGFFDERVDQALVDRELTAARNHHTERVENVPAGAALQIVEAALYPAGHPYRAGLVRGAAGLAGLTAAEVRAFAAAHFTPERATLSVCGDFDVTRTSALIARYFGTLPAARAAPRRVAARPILTGQIRLRVAANVPAPRVIMVWPTPEMWGPGDEALDLAAQLLTGRRAGFLRVELVNKLHLATSVYAHQHSRRLGSEFVIDVTAARGHTTAELVTAIDGVLVQLRKEPLSKYWISAAISGHLIDQIFALESHQVRAARYALCDEAGILDDCVRIWVSHYYRLDVPQVVAAMADHLPLDRRMIAEVEPDASAPIAGELRATETRR